jgi:hypothetical protein
MSGMVEIIQRAEALQTSIGQALENGRLSDDTRDALVWSLIDVAGVVERLRATPFITTEGIVGPTGATGAQGPSRWT